MCKCMEQTSSEHKCAEQRGGCVEHQLPSVARRSSPLSSLDPNCTLGLGRHVAHTELVLSYLLKVTKLGRHRRGERVSVEGQRGDHLVQLGVWG